MFDALCDHLTEKPGLYVEEMAIFLWDEFNILLLPSSIKRALSRGRMDERESSAESKRIEPLSTRFLPAQTIRVPFILPDLCR
jgi:hypothetical protein